MVIVFCGGGWFVGVIKHPQLDQGQLGEVWLAAIGATVVIWLAVIRSYRRAAYRERAAGYTTLFGKAATIDLPSRGAAFSITLFSTTSLWQLDAKTGKVLRRPGEQG